MNQRKNKYNIIQMIESRIYSCGGENKKFKVIQRLIKKKEKRIWHNNNNNDGVKL